MSVVTRGLRTTTLPIPVPVFSRWLITPVLAATLFTACSGESQYLSELRTRAEAGETAAMIELGDSLFDREFGAAMAEYRRAAELGDTDAMLVLSDIYRDGRGVEQSSVVALRWYTRAATIRYPEAETSEIAVYSLRAGNGDVDAMKELASTYYRGIGVPVNLAQYRRWMQAAAEAGDVEAMKSIARAYGFGIGIPVDGAQYLRWMEAAADAGDPGAVQEVGMSYQIGMSGTPEDPGEAARWYLRGIEMGDPFSMLGYAEVLEQSMGDTATGLTWLARGSVTRIGTSHSLEEKVGPEAAARLSADAFQWWMEQAEDGGASEYFWIARATEMGYGTEADPGRALNWYRRAVAAGYEEARPYVTRLSVR